MPSAHDLYRVDLWPDGERVPFWETGFLFNQWRHLRQQRPLEQPRLVLAVNRQSGLAEARCAVWLGTDGVAVSPAAAPFGSVEFAPTVPDDVLTEFVDLLLKTVEEAGCKQFIIKHYPASYAPDQTDRLRSALARNGFVETVCHENSHLPVTNALFADRISPAARRRLRQAHAAGLHGVHWPHARLTEALEFIGQSRQRQGYPLTLLPDQLRELFADFPDAFQLVAVLDGAVLASLTVAVRVSARVLYNFLPVDNLDYRHLSPAILLTETLYNFCRQTHTALLDLGVSLNDDRTHKPSLLRFKRGLGAQSSDKIVFAWQPRL